MYNVPIETAKPEIEMDIREGIVNTGKGKRPFKARVHGSERMSAFSTFEAAKKAKDDAHKKAMAEAHDIQTWDGWKNA